MSFHRKAQEIADRLCSSCGKRRAISKTKHGVKLNRPRCRYCGCEPPLLYRVAVMVESGGLAHEFVTAQESWDAIEKIEKQIQQKPKRGYVMVVTAERAGR